jgi:hypothetical protein
VEGRLLADSGIAIGSDAISGTDSLTDDKAESIV